MPPKPAISPLGRALAGPLEDAHVPRTARTRLRTWLRQVEGQHSRNTQSAWARDWRAFAECCARNQQSALPAEPLSVALFIYESLKAGKQRATVRAAVSTIARVHRAAGLADPVPDKAAQPALAEVKARRTSPSRLAAWAHTVQPLCWAQIERFLALPPQRLRDYRDRALIVVGYDALCQPQELTRMNLSEVRRGPSRASLHFPHAPHAPGSLVPQTLQLIDEWVQAAQLREGALFRRINKGGKVLGALRVAAISTIVKEVGKRIGLSAEECQRLSAKSLRLGAKLDMHAQGIPDQEIAYAGRWQRLPVSVQHERDMPREHCRIRVARAQGRV